ncbi:alpha/beta hydrolase [Amycolatopsis sp. OK19-0408]|uniref:Alpha/beta hydrolase n=1 Tax=Amycolatopsis iheyensis TaxID=2945988 RepID=A0A9X2SNF4_9PSEU|nr:alpha/beta hydrolase [Amycolatopsis iheyensis]MCR6488932.1 alpha/beta hydrolase [Amycolatopsis iheyensis]
MAVGRGPTCLLLHAGGERRGVWTPVSRILVGAGFRCVAYDQRGHGDSGGSPRELAQYAGDVAAMLHTEPPGSVVVGASLGGLAAIAALGDPTVRARAAGLVLVDVVPCLDPRRVRRFLSGSGVRDAYPELVDDILAQVPLLRQVTTRLDLPVLLVRGGSGSPVTDEDVNELVRSASRATVTCVRGAGHLVARDQPVALAETVADVTAEWPAAALLRELGAGLTRHPGGNLFDHLQRVRDLVAGWGGSRRVRLAALCHAAYGTDGFPPPLLPPGRRTRLRAAVGDEAEALVHRYSACDRKRTYAGLGGTPLPFADRFTGAVTDLAGDDLADFALLTVANELDVARTVPLAPEARRGIRALVTALAGYVPEAAARALADPALVSVQGG